MLQQELVDGMLTLRLARPEKRNALSRALMTELAAAVGRAYADPAVRGILLAGAGPDFSAGVDLAEFASLTPSTAPKLIAVLRDLCRAVRTGPKPVVAAVQGHCLGGAFEVVLACDLRVADRHARFGLPEVALGLPSVIDAALLPGYVGWGRAADMLLTGRLMTAREAFRLGLVNRLAPADALEDAGRALLQEVLRHSPRAVRLQKELHDVWRNAGLEDAVAFSVRSFAAAFVDGVPDPLRRRLERR
ncbi:MAG: enoyl-CoA hydratase/isomerase family protein [Actinomycetia bacterium]|nr:enoyl-CoA hydratase/isomerase family protein [Actinomycetes bacterium]